MSRRHVLILVLAAVVLTCFSVALSRRDSRDWRATRSRRLLPFPWQDAVSATLVWPDGRSRELTRASANEWLVRLEGGGTDILSASATDCLAALATLSQRNPRPDLAPPNPERAVTLTVASQSGQTVRIAFGDIRNVKNNYRAATVDDDRSVVYGVNQDLLGFLDWPEERFRDMYLMAAGGGREADKIVLAPHADDPSLTVTLVHKAGGWHQETPVDWPVNPERIDLLLRWLERFRGESVAAENPTNLSTYGLDQPVGYVEAVYKSPSGNIVRRALFGRDTGSGGVYVKMASRTPVFVVPKRTLTEISMIAVKNHPRLWRNYYRQRTLDLTRKADPVEYRIERLLPDPATLIVTKPTTPHASPDAEWNARYEDETGMYHFTVEPPDPSFPLRPLSSLHSGLSSLRVKAFLSDDADFDVRTGESENRTRFPAWRISCRAKDGEESPLLILYAARPNGRLAVGEPYVDGDADQQNLGTGPDGRAGIAFSVSGRPGLLETYPNAAYQFCLPLYRYRSRQLLNLNARDFAKISLTVGGRTTVYFRRPGDYNNQWWKNPDDPAPIADDNNPFAAMLQTLSQLRADGFVADGSGDKSKFGLDQPEITAIVYRSRVASADTAAADDRVFTLSLGKTAVQTGSRYARLDDDGPVFILPERLVTALSGDYR